MCWSFAQEIQIMSIQYFTNEVKQEAQIGTMYRERSGNTRISSTEITTAKREQSKKT